MRLARLTFLCLTLAGPAAGQEVQARMQTWAKALGVECAYCHVPGAWADRSKPTFDFARRMSLMLDGLNEGPIKALGGTISCWTCHRGLSRPARLPRTAWEQIRDTHAAEFSSRPDRALAMSVYSASLGVDCSHCHEPGNWTAAGKRPFAMVGMMDPIFGEIPKHFVDSRQPSTQCYMCHQGRVTPERSPR